MDPKHDIVKSEKMFPLRKTTRSARVRGTMPKNGYASHDAYPFVNVCPAGEPGGDQDKDLPKAKMAPLATPSNTREP